MGMEIQHLRAMITSGLFVAFGLTTPNALAAGGDFCGDLFIGPTEQCEDGNDVSGDGCSSDCLIENNYTCTAPDIPTANNVVPDPGFEAGIDGTPWNRFTTVNEDVLCNPEICEMSFARSGAWWARFGSLETTEDASILEQRFEIPVSHRWLEFDLAIPDCDFFGNTFSVVINQETVRTYTGNSPGCGIRGYQTQRIDLETALGGPYNNGDLNLLTFVSTSVSAANGPTVFWVDNVRVVEQIDDTTPGSCELDSFVLSNDSFDPPSGGDLSVFGLTTFELGDPIPWGSTDDGVCGSGDVPPGNFTGGMGEAACLDASTAPGASIVSFLCLDAIDFTNADNTQLSFLLNLQLNPTTQANSFQVLVGDTPPDAGSINGFLPVLALFNSVGEFGSVPGQEITVNLDLLNGTEEGYICFAFVSVSAFYAQVDNVSISAECTDEVDEDKLLNCFDNCINVDNADQTDSDGDGYGNACDADISRELNSRLVPSGNGNDCVVNFADLGVLRQAFFASPLDEQWNPDADFNNDQKINFEDLGIMRSLFFSNPGPSGSTSQCSP